MKSVNSMSLKHAILIAAVAASLGAAGIHFAVIEEHLAEYALFGYLFLALAWFQVLWAFSMFLRFTPVAAWLGVAVNAGAVAVWLMARTTGLPIGPDPWQPEAIGALDVAASVLELVIVACMLVLIEPRSRAMVTAVRVRYGWLVMVLSGAVVIAITTLAFAWQDVPEAMR